MRLFSLLHVFALCAVSAFSQATCALYGMQMVHNGPVQVSFVRVNIATANMTFVGDGTPVVPEAAMGDLSAVDLARGVFYFLGDSHAGATLVGLNLSDAAVVCSSTVAVEEVEFVGIGQSLDFDSSLDRLVLTGLVNRTSGVAHTLLTFPPLSETALKTAEIQEENTLKTAESRGIPSCGVPKSVGDFAVADYVPMLHSSALNVEGQQLFVTLATGPSDFAVGVVDTKKGALMQTIPMDTPDHTLLGMHYLPSKGLLVGVLPDAEGTRLQLKTLDPNSQAWTVYPLDTAYVALGGNEGTESALDASGGGTLYVWSKKSVSDPAYHLLAVSVDTATVKVLPALTSVGIGGVPLMLEHVCF